MPRVNVFFQHVVGRTEENQQFSITLSGLLVANQSRSTPKKKKTQTITTQRDILLDEMRSEFLNVFLTSS